MLPDDGMKNLGFASLLEETSLSSSSATFEVLQSSECAVSAVSVCDMGQKSCNRHLALYSKSALLTYCHCTGEFGLCT